MASDIEPGKFFNPPPEVSPKVIFGAGQNLLALQFEYIVTLANCNKASIKKSSADSLARSKI